MDDSSSFPFEVGDLLAGDFHGFSCGKLGEARHHVLFGFQFGSFRCGGLFQGCDGSFACTVFVGQGFGVVVSFDRLDGFETGISGDFGSRTFGFDYGLPGFFSLSFGFYSFGLDSLRGLGGRFKGFCVGSGGCGFLGIFGLEVKFTRFHKKEKN